MFLYLACPASISFFFLAICGVGHPLTIIIWFNKVVVVVDLEPLTFRIHLAYQSFFYTTTPQDSELRFIPLKLIFILLDSLARPKINIIIYCMLHAARKHASHLWVLGE